MGISGLDAALAGLRVSQQQINVISNNVANVGTPGYTRKILPQSSQALQGVTYGVAAETIIRNVDLNLQRNLWTQVSAINELDIQQSYLQRVEQFHGPPDAELSLAAEIARLRDSFSSLAESPEDPFVQASTINQAIDTANKINDFSDLVNTMRNDAQDDIEETVNRINSLLEQIADINEEVRNNLNLGRTTAFYEDQRDSAIQELSELIEISTFVRGDGVLVVQTNRGQELASDRAEALFFNRTPVSATSSYPDSINGIYVRNPDDQASVDITTLSPGGKLGGLLTLRDVTLPKQTAQIDELAHKLALRLDAQGLRLFTDGTGAVPSDAPPDPTTDPPTPVEYVGFAGTIQVNQAIIDNPLLLKDGTYGASLATGSNEVVRRVLEFGFGDVNYQEAANIDLTTQVDLLNTGGADLQTWLGLFSSNDIVGSRDLTPFASIADLVLSADGALDDPDDQFQITFEEARTGLGPTTITIDLSDADALGVGTNATEQLVDYINNTVLPASGISPDLAVVASVGVNGQLQIETRGSYEIDSNGVNGIGDEGLIFLGLSDNAGAPIAPQDPYFDIQIGNADPVRITLEPGDTSVELLAKLDAVDGLAVDTANFAIDGVLRIRPGNDYDNPDFGGDIKIIGGPFDTAGAGYGAPPAAGLRAAIDDGANIVSALFGTYSVSGAAILDESPVLNYAHGSQTDGSIAPPIPTVPFRESLLGPDANISTGVIGSLELVDFAQKIVNEHTQELILVGRRSEDESSLRDALETQFLDDSAVNLDEELGNLIVAQTAYSASARVLTAVDELFQELLNAVR